MFYTCSVFLTCHFPSIVLYIFLYEVLIWQYNFVRSIASPRSDFSAHISVLIFPIKIINSLCFSILASSGFPLLFLPLDFLSLVLTRGNTSSCYEGKTTSFLVFSFPPPFPLTLDLQSGFPFQHQVSIFFFIRPCLSTLWRSWLSNLATPYHD